jgi:hypothetical protein
MPAECSVVLSRLECDECATPVVAAGLRRLCQDPDPTSVRVAVDSAPGALPRRRDGPCRTAGLPC